METAWITGARGLIGNYLVACANRSHSLPTPLLSSASSGTKRWRARGIARPEVELTDFTAVRKLFEAERPTLMIHCAALSKSPACQADPALARRLNVDVTAFLAELAADIPFFLFSTDLVFDGRQGNYVETAPVRPLSVYAETKVAAERVVLRNPRHTIIRTSLNGGNSPTGDRGFNEEMRRAWREGKTLNLFIDEYRSPISAAVTAQAIWELAERGATGIYHVAGSQRLSRWEIGQLLAARWPDLNPKLEAGTLKDYRGAPRAPDTSLNCAKAQNSLGFRLPGLTEWLLGHPKEVF